MTQLHCDQLIVGGELAGATLAGCMALTGYRTRIIEKELKIRDRIRGEDCTEQEVIGARRPC